jgi:hypothetical protein
VEAAGTAGEAFGFLATGALTELEPVLEPLRVSTIAWRSTNEEENEKAENKYQGYENKRRRARKEQKIGRLYC